MAANGAGAIQSGVFEDLQKKIDEDTQIKDVRFSLRMEKLRFPDDAGEAKG